MISSINDLQKCTLNTTTKDDISDGYIENIYMPDIGIRADERVEVIDILVSINQDINLEQPLIVVEGSKTSVEVPSPCAGTVTAIVIKVGDKLASGDLIITVRLSNVSDNQLSSISLSSSKKKDAFENHWNGSHATPIVRRLARNLNVDLKKVKGTGRKNRILCEDIHKYISNQSSFLSQEKKSKSNISKKNENCSIFLDENIIKFGKTKKVKLSLLKRVASTRLMESWSQIPHVTHFDKIDVTDLEEFRKKKNKDYIQKNEVDLKITPIAFIIKAVSFALEKMPLFNSSISKDGNNLFFRRYINIGVVVETSDGLVIPVIKSVTSKRIISIAEELKELTKKSRSGKLNIQDMEGGCFTISSIGKLGTTHFCPIINAPEVAILGISKYSVEPIWNGKEFIPKVMMPISLSFDHRVIDGSDGARFINILHHVLGDIRHLIM